MGETLTEQRHPRGKGLHRGTVVAAALALLIASSLAIALWRATPETVLPAAEIGGPFVLTDVNGARFESASLRGRPYAVFFGYTHCPDVCPTALLDLTQAIAGMGERGKDIALVFISVDPARDTPATMKTYVETVNPRIIGLTGSEGEIAAVAKSFRVLYRAGPNEGGAYAVDHTALTYLFDRAGRFVAAIPGGDTQDGMTAKLGLIAGAR